MQAARNVIAILMQYKLVLCIQLAGYVFQLKILYYRIGTRGIMEAVAGAVECLCWLTWQAPCF